MSVPVVQFDRVVKNYSGLRPLRVAALELQPGERVAISGMDAVAAELFVNLVTGATLPDDGVVRAFGKSTAEIGSGDEWLASLDQFGIVSPRGILLEGATLQQNLVMPFTLQIDPVQDEIAERVASLAAECGIDAGSLVRPAVELPPDVRARAHLARAVALEPQLVIMEHPTAGVPDAQRAAFARDVAAVVQSRGMTVLAITMDEEFAQAVAHRSLALNGATGALMPWKRKRGWFR